MGRTDKQILALCLLLSMWLAEFKTRTFQGIVSMVLKDVTVQKLLKMVFRGLKLKCPTMSLSYLRHLIKVSPNTYLF